MNCTEKKFIYTAYEVIIYYQYGLGDFTAKRLISTARKVGGRFICHFHGGLDFWDHIDFHFGHIGKVERFVVAARKINNEFVDPGKIRIEAIQNIPVCKRKGITRQCLSKKKVKK